MTPLEKKGRRILLEKEWKRTLCSFAVKNLALLLNGVERKSKL
jgi:hypothetical protein